MTYVKKGYKKKITDEMLVQIKEKLSGSDSITEIVKEFGVSRVSIYNKAKKDSELANLVYKRKLSRPHLRNQVDLSHDNQAE
jgi:predicted DNA-binding protein YlxM (UPF0122 family)